MSVTAEGVKVDLADVEVDSDTAAAQIEAALGMESGTLAANGIEVQAGASVTIPSELVTVDTSGMQSATQQAADETETEPIEMCIRDRSLPSGERAFLFASTRLWIEANTKKG